MSSYVFVEESRGEGAIAAYDLGLGAHRGASKRRKMTKGEREAAAKARSKGGSRPRRTTVKRPRRKRGTRVRSGPSSFLPPFSPPSQQMTPPTTSLPKGAVVVDSGAVLIPVPTETTGTVRTGGSPPPNAAVNTGIVRPGLEQVTLRSIPIGMPTGGVVRPQQTEQAWADEDMVDAAIEAAKSEDEVLAPTKGGNNKTLLIVGGIAAAGLLLYWMK